MKHHRKLILDMSSNMKAVSLGKSLSIPAGRPGLIAMVFLFWPATIVSIHAQSFTINFSGLNLNIPDGGELSDTRIVTTDITAIGKLTVSLNISGRLDGAYNGDFYATLLHDSGFSVLLNRVGRRGSSGVESLGYGDDGLDVTFDDSAVNGDIHVYRATLFDGDHTMALESPNGPPLPGIWAPDARTTDPADVLIGDTRTAFLSSFDNLNPNGSWTLFVADESTSSTGRLNSWGLTITPVPEIEEWTVLTAFALLAWGVWRKAIAQSADRGRTHGN